MLLLWLVAGQGGPEGMGAVRGDQWALQRKPGASLVARRGQEHIWVRVSCVGAPEKEDQGVGFRITASKHRGANSDGPLQW